MSNVYHDSSPPNHESESKCAMILSSGPSSGMERMFSIVYSLSNVLNLTDASYMFGSERVRATTLYFSRSAFIVSASLSVDTAKGADPVHEM